jgi:peptidoglycan-N-acetylglucosamine deacetylase
MKNNVFFRIIIIVMISILLFLFLRLFYSNIVTQTSSSQKEKALKGEKSYMKLYPDMYVESVKPIIQIKEKKIAYLTFDDGPSQTTNEILDILKENEVHATFFILGSTITEEGEECLKDMVEQGHTIGIHTYSHNYKNIYSSVDAYLSDFYKVYNQIYEITGLKVNIFRFPWGSKNNYNKGIKDELVAEMERRGFTYYDWNVSAEDSVGEPTAYGIKNNILKDLDRYNNPVILMHDASINSLTADTLPDIIDTIVDKGYEFDTLDHRKPYQFSN